ncbi:hypothetical protein AAFC00_005588 [Neodothiora populina]|uniref:Alcohol acetyltransferase n=1 Tax=Neodothiora populina TaxID=2781224 RepID=A0ABR3PLN8_9PEZI
MTTTLRLAGINERRCIVRQTLDYYRCLIVGGIYECSIADGPPKDWIRQSAIKAIKHCIATHPVLSTTIIGEATESPAYARPPHLDLNNHVQLLEGKDVSDRYDAMLERDVIKLVIPQIHDQVLTARDEIPPWKVVIVPLASRNGRNRYLILLAYYHSHGDGKSGLAFHQSFLSGLRMSSSPTCPYDDETKISLSDAATTKPLPPPIDEGGQLKITWSYLLSPLLGAYLPKTITDYFNLRAAATPESPDQWRGEPTFHDDDNPSTFKTGLDFVTVNNETMTKVLAKCKSHSTKFTGLLHQLIVRALSQGIPAETAGSFVSGTAVDLRRHAASLSDDDMAVCASVYFELFARADVNAWTGWAAAADDASIWVASRATTEGLARRAESLVDQPVGLLAYLRNFYPWMKDQVGKPRDSSYELSNLLSFSPRAEPQSTSTTSPRDTEDWTLSSVLFSQPANAVGSGLNFNVVTLKGGDMVLMLTWQLGVLGVDDEQRFAERVCSSIGSSLDVLASA